MCNKQDFEIEKSPFLEYWKRINDILFKNLRLVPYSQGVNGWMVLVVFFRFFEIKHFCFLTFFVIKRGQQ